MTASAILKAKVNMRTEMKKMIVTKEKGLSLKIDLKQNTRPGLAPYNLQILPDRGDIYWLRISIDVPK
jgi:hypothetical protein